MYPLALEYSINVYNSVLNKNISLCLQMSCILFDELFQVILKFSKYFLISEIIYNNSILTGTKCFVYKRDQALKFYNRH